MNLKTLAAFAALGAGTIFALPSQAGERIHYGPRGGSYAVSQGCVAGFVDRCYRSVTAVGPHGRAYVADRGIAVGPYRARGVTRVVGPRGYTVVRTGRWIR
ncbi:MAG: hypothetical protein V7704_03560 [Aurantimonas endophytica]|uniref:Uncharacterized protein n=1 Tax=Aurantimonas endophytica TaxID=1522175 RepID=A0A7W6HGN9_9HYPH|nr:hypothetical protein [Aurantimonas endophytica]MBB4004881.1 hypothetical protein [Aurantimonas endophytica]MCO6405691.1 hypothetical protein [Aurantimonas endophytica]